MKPAPSGFQFGLRVAMELALSVIGRVGSHPFQGKIAVLFRLDSGEGLGAPRRFLVHCYLDCCGVAEVARLPVIVRVQVPLKFPAIARFIGYESRMARLSTSREMFAPLT